MFLRIEYNMWGLRFFRRCIFCQIIAEVSEERAAYSSESSVNIYQTIWCHIQEDIVTFKSITRQRPQHTRGQQYGGSVFFMSAVTSHNNSG
jgi:hypothetical protein